MKKLFCFLSALVFGVIGITNAAYHGSIEGTGVLTGRVIMALPLSD